MNDTQAKFVALLLFTSLWCIFNVLVAQLLSFARTGPIFTIAILNDAFYPMIVVGVATSTYIMFGVSSFFLKDK